MTVEQVYHHAELEWQNQSNLRAKYATFIYYWHERYERVYGIEYRVNKFLLWPPNIELPQILYSNYFIK